MRMHNVGSGHSRGRALGGLRARVGLLIVLALSNRRCGVTPRSSSNMPLLVTYKTARTAAAPPQPAHMSVFPHSMLPRHALIPAMQPVSVIAPPTLPNDDRDVHVVRPARQPISDGVRRCRARVAGESTGTLSGARPSGGGRCGA
jgi:hypothetical protein